MSNALYPTLAGLSFNNTKTPKFNTGVQQSVSLNELRVAYASTPVYLHRLQYELLRDDTTNNELRQLVGFYLARQGSFDSFLFKDPTDSVALLEPFGTGDGAETEFQLKRAYGVFTEAVSNIGTGPSIYKAGVLQSTGYTVSSTGLVTFSSAPANGVALTWSGLFYFRCRFLQDETEFEQFMYQLWEAKQVEFLGSLGTKI